MTSNGNILDNSAFRSLYQKPSIADMLSLHPKDFEQFVLFIFTQAGYSVKLVADRHFPAADGFDLELYAPNTQNLMGFVEVRRFQENHAIDTDQMMAFIGKLTVAKSREVPGYMVTTSSFNKNALTAAERQGNVFPLSGETFLRYINYIRGSHLILMGTETSHFSIPISPRVLFKGEQISFISPNITTVLAFANNKGGVAKSTSALNIGFALAAKNEKVLLVDMDAQCSLSKAVPPPDGAQEKTLLEYFTQRSPMMSLIRPTRFPGIDILAAHSEMTYIDPGGSANPDREALFAQHFHELLQLPDIQSKYRWALIDTPPAQTFFTRAAIGASHFVIMPVVLESLAAVPIKKAITTVRTMEALFDHHNTILGFLVTRWENTGSVKDNFLEIGELSDNEEIPIFDTRIPKDGRIEIAHINTIRGKTKNLFGFKSSAAHAYNAVLEEILNHVNNHYIPAQQIIRTTE